MAAAASPQHKKYDVFISFRGLDIRNGFLSHLHKALTRDGIDTFVDENLERGEDISSSLFEMIEHSYLSLVIFSENYAFSPWCLDELVKIVECKKTIGQMLLPVFYGVDPTNVQDLTGSFGVAISKHREEEFNYPLYRVKSWCQALKETAELSGLVSQNVRPDSKLIEEIVNHILHKLNKVFQNDCCNNDRLVGIDSRVNYVKSLLCLESEDVRVTGMWGMGGIGKTTIAKKVFDQICDQFTSHYFVESVREKLEKCTSDHLHSEVLSGVLEKKIFNAATPVMLSSFDKKRLSRRKVLIVLDDVCALKQIEPLVHADYGLGSRIIITSRDKQLLKHGCSEIYEVEELCNDEALWLFCLHAFKKGTPEEGYELLSRRAVGYAQGLPLALKVLGSNLYGKSAEEWEDELKKLCEISDGEIRKILRISYDGLYDEDKEMFLDIACFFQGNDRDYFERIFGVGSRIGISRLIDKSLISVSDNKLQMHDLIQKMGKDIVSEEKQLGRRSRLWHHQDVCYVLTKNKGTEATKGLSLDMSKIKDVQLSPKALEGFDNLRVLNFYDSNHDHLQRKNKVHLPKGLKSLPDALRFLHWYRCPLKSLPISFCAENIVELRMVESKLKELWDGVQHLVNLKSIDVRHSKDLVRIPDLSRATNLEYLSLSGCSSLVEIPSSLKYSSKLAELDLSFCYRLQKLPSCLHLKSLKRLSLLHCSEIKELPKILCYKRHARTAIQQVPSSFQLSVLNLFACSTLQSLSDNICNLKCLKYLNIGKCVNLHGLPEKMGNLESLKRLNARQTGIKQIPDSICNLKYLCHLDISGCANLHRLPENFGNLSSLEKLIAKGSGIKKLPDSICNLKYLWHIDTSGCVNLAALPEKLQNLTSLWMLYASRSGIKYLPQLPSLHELDVRNCRSLTSASTSFQLVKEQAKVRDFRFENCLNLGEEERNQMMDHSLERPYRLKTDYLAFKDLCLCVPGSEVAQKMKYQNKGGSSLSLSLAQFERWWDIQALYFCAVYDPNLFDNPVLDFEVTGTNSPYCSVGCEISLGHEHGYVYYMYYDKLESKHVFLWRREFNPGKHPPDPIVFSFFAEDYDRSKSSRCYDAITECAVHPIFCVDDMLSDSEAESYADEDMIRDVDSLDDDDAEN